MNPLLRLLPVLFLLTLPRAGAEATRPNVLFIAVRGGDHGAGKVKGRSIGGIKFGIIDGGDEGVPDTQIADYGIAELAKNHDRRFFLTLGFHKPHMPWNVPQNYYDMHPLGSIEFPPVKEGDLSDLPAAGVKMAGADGNHAKVIASGRWKEAVQAYLAAISYLDGQVGALKSELAKHFPATNAAPAIGNGNAAPPSDAEKAKRRAQRLP